MAHAATSRTVVARSRWHPQLPMKRHGTTIAAKARAHEDAGMQQHLLQPEATWTVRAVATLQVSLALEVELDSVVSLAVRHQQQTLRLVHCRHCPGETRSAPGPCSMSVAAQSWVPQQAVGREVARPDTGHPPGR